MQVWKTKKPKIPTWIYLAWTETIFEIGAYGVPNKSLHQIVLGQEGLVSINPKLLGFVIYLDPICTSLKYSVC